MVEADAVDLAYHNFLTNLSLMMWKETRWHLAKYFEITDS